MKRLTETDLNHLHQTKLSKIENTRCLLDLTPSSNLLSSKIADIPQKLKYETILKPLFEYCFGTCNDDQVWEPVPTEFISSTSDEDTFNSIEIDEDTDEFQVETNPADEQDHSLYYQIDWKRDFTFIYEQMLDLVFAKFNFIARKFKLWKERKFVLNCIEDWPGRAILKYTHFQLKENDGELVMKALDANLMNLYFAPQSIRHDKEIVIKLLRREGAALAYAPNPLTRDKEIVMIAVKSNGIAYECASEALQKDREVALTAVKSRNSLPFRKLSYELDDDREFLLELAKIDGYEALKYASEQLRDDREIVMQAVKRNSSALKFASPELKKDRELVKMAVMKESSSFEYASIELQQDQELVKLSQQAPTKKKWSYTFAKPVKFVSNIPNESLYDREIVLNAIKENPQNLEIVPIELKNDREFILKAVSINGLSLKYLSNEDDFKKDREIVMAAITQNGNAINFASHFWQDKELLLKASETFSDHHLKFEISDRHLILQYVEKCPSIFHDLPRKFIRERELIFAALKSKENISTILGIASAKWKADRLFVLRCVKLKGRCWGMSLKFKNDMVINQILKK